MAPLKHKIAESYRMEFQTFMKRVHEYMSNNNISTNGTMNREDIKKAYEEGLYPSEFVKEYIKNIDDKAKRGGYSKSWESDQD